MFYGYAKNSYKKSPFLSLKSGILSASGNSAFDFILK